MNAVSDTMLVGKAALGDRRAFDALVSRHALPLRRYLLRLTGDPPLADDLAQETFIKAYCRIGTFGGLAGFRTWLFRIGYNAFCSYRRGEHEAGELDDSLPADETADPDTVHDVQAALARLRTEERSALLLYYMEDFPVAKVSAIMHLPVGTVKSHLKRGRDKLETFLKQNGYETE